MSIQQALQKKIDESKRALDGSIDDTIYRREHSKRIELINWVLENMKKPDIQICDLIESKMNEIILKINQTREIFEADKLHSELRILDWIFYQVCSNEIKQFERLRNKSNLRSITLKQQSLLSLLLPLLLPTSL
jgi:hypothetical protein